MFEYPELNQAAWDKIEEKRKVWRWDYYTKILLPALPDKLRGRISEACIESEKALSKAIRRAKKAGATLEKTYNAMNFPQQYFDPEMAVYEFKRAYRKRFVEEQVLPRLRQEIKRRLEDGGAVGILKALQMKIWRGHAVPEDFEATWQLVVVRLIRKDTFNLEKYVRDLLRKAGRLGLVFPQYEEPEVPNRNYAVHAIRNTYRFFEFAYPDALPLNTISKDGVPKPVYRLFGKGTQILEIRKLLYSTMPAYVSVIVFGNKRKRETLERLGLPEIVTRLSPEEAEFLYETTRKYEDYCSLERQVKKKTLLGVYLKASPKRKMAASPFLFRQVLPVKNLKNAYVHLLNYLERRGYAFPEFLAGKHAQGNIPGQIFEMVGLNLKDTIGLKERYFDILPRIGTEALRRRREVHDAPDFVRTLRLDIEDYEELSPYLGHFKDYGVLDSAKFQYLQTSNIAKVVSRIFFNSALLDPALRERDIANILKLRKLCSVDRKRSRFESGDPVPKVVFYKFDVPVGDFGALNDAVSNKLLVREIPHLYFDKNIIFVFARYKLFGKIQEINAITLVGAVLKGEIKGSVSLDCLKATYNHLRFRLTHPETEGGLEFSEERAENQARLFLDTYFFQQDSPWNLVNVNEKLFKEAVTRKKREFFSLEDTIEYYTFQKASSQVGGPTIFVTDDKHFEDGVHPVDAVQSHRQSISKIFRREPNA